MSRIANFIPRFRVTSSSHMLLRLVVVLVLPHVRQLCTKLDKYLLDFLQFKLFNVYYVIYSMELGVHGRCLFRPGKLLETRLYKYLRRLD